MNTDSNYVLLLLYSFSHVRSEALREASRRHEADADRAVDDLVESRSEITRLEEEVPRLAGRYRVFQQLRGYFTDLVDCFDEKVTSVF
jgi:GC-rich sequence DNA-binding factor